MTLEQAIVSALDYEVRVRDYYARAADSTNDPKGREVFGALAAEEQGHVDYLKERLVQWRETGIVSSPEPATTLPKPEWLRAARTKVPKTGARRDFSNEIAMLKHSARLEDEVTILYRQLVADLPQDQSAMFRRFLEIEDGHTAVVQAELDALQKDGFWFDWREFDLEAG